MAFATDIPTWIETLLEIIRPINGAWVTAYELKVKDKIHQNTLSFREVSAALRVMVAKMRHNTKSFGKGSSFGPTFAGEISSNGQGMDASLSDQDGDEERKNKRTRKRGRAGEDSTSKEGSRQCPACDKPHDISGCWYLFPNKAHKRWKAFKAIQEKVNKRLKEDSNLAEEVARMKLQMSRTNSVKQDES
jgi:hypothetical protein